LGKCNFSYWLNETYFPVIFESNDLQDGVEVSKRNCGNKETESKKGNAKPPTKQIEIKAFK